MPIGEIFDDSFMNDMLLNPDPYGMEGGLHDVISSELLDIMNDKFEEKKAENILLYFSTKLQ